MTNGWFSMSRKIRSWEWYSDPYTTKIWLDCIAQAYFSNSEWRGIKIKRGQFPTTLEMLATINGLTIQQTRTALKNLQTTNEIEVQTTNRYSIITVKNYDTYQIKNNRKTNSNNKQSRGSNNKPCINNNINNIKKKNIYSSSSSKEEFFSKISEEEEELLKNHSKRNGVKYFKPWLRKVLNNNDYKEILEKERKLQEKEAKKKEKQSKYEIEKEENIILDTPEEVNRKTKDLRKELSKRLRERCE